MATETLAVLGQVSGTASVTTYTNLYACPTSTTVVISTIAVCNTASTAATYRLGIGTASTTLAANEFLQFGTTVPANDTVYLTIGAVMTATAKYLNVSSSASTVTFAAFGATVV